jgi:putative lipoic acid-binding regulatory protein
VNELPTLDLLEATHAFPGTYAFKAIGANRDGFAARIVASVRLELELEFDPPFEVRHTAQGRHVSVTVTPPIASAPQVLAIYARLRAIDGLVMLF